MDPTAPVTGSIYAELFGGGTCDGVWNQGVKNHRVRLLGTTRRRRAICGGLFRASDRSIRATAVVRCRGWNGGGRGNFQRDPTECLGYSRGGSVFQAKLF